MAQEAKVLEGKEVKTSFTQAQQDLLDKDTSGNAEFGISLWVSQGTAVEFNCEFKRGSKGGWFVGPVGSNHGVDLNSYYDIVKDMYDLDKNQTFSLTIILQKPRALTEVTETLEWMKSKGYSDATYKRHQKQSLTRLSLSSMVD